LGIVELEGSLQAVEGVELHIAKALGPAVDLVLDNSHVRHLAVLKELFNLFALGVKRKVSEMRGVWRLGGKGKGIAIGHALCEKLALSARAFFGVPKEPCPKVAELTARRSPYPPRESKHVRLGQRAHAKHAPPRGCQ
jgi:hypothetical protein